MSINGRNIGIWVVGVIAATVLGNSTWDWIFKPSIIWAFNTIIELVNTFSTSVIDDIYARGMQQELHYKEANLQVSVQILMILVIFLFTFFLELTPLHQDKQTSNESITKDRILNKIIWIGFLAIAANIAFEAYKTRESSLYYEFAYRTVEDVRPVISEQEYYTIKSKMRAISTKHEYRTFLSSLGPYIKRLMDNNDGSSKPENE